MFDDDWTVWLKMPQELEDPEKSPHVLKRGVYQWGLVPPSDEGEPVAFYAGAAGECLQRLPVNVIVTVGVRDQALQPTGKPSPQWLPRGLQPPYVPVPFLNPPPVHWW
jgi:hypothetical protein